MKQTRPALRFVKYWGREIALGYRNLVNLSRGLPPELPPEPLPEPPPDQPETPDMPAAALPNETGPGSTGAAAMADSAPAPDAAPATSGQAEPPDPAKLWEQPSAITDLTELLTCRRTSRQTAETDVPFNDPEKEAERQQRIQANLAEIARRELAMQQYIQANAEQAARRKAEIEDEIKALALRLNEIETQRSAAGARKQAEIENSLDQLTGAARAIFNRIDQLEEERKFIRQSTKTRHQPNNVLIEEIVQKRQHAIQSAARSNRDTHRAEQIRRARELRIKHRAERLARMMAHRAEEIAAQKEQARLSRMRDRS